jgi:predicted exporter
VSRAAAALWLAVVLAATAYVGWRVERGLSFQTDLMALLPMERHDPTLQRANELMTSAIAKRIVLLVGHETRDGARAAAAAVESALLQAGVMKTDRGPMPDAVRQLVAVYAAHGAGLISDADRQRLLDGQADQIVSRALAQISMPAAPIDGRQLVADPFLLLPAFLVSLPSPAGRLVADAGWLSTSDRGRTWVMVSGELLGDAYALDFQERFARAYDEATTAATRTTPGAAVLRMGVLFYAQAGAREGLDEISMIGIVSTVAIVLLVVSVFRGVLPLVLCVSAIAVGILVSMSACLLIFGNLHVIALLFGTTLIGAAVDYGLYYCAQSFSVRRAPADRLRHVIAGLTLGLVTSLVGYAAMALTPLTGLYQIAAFSVVGLAAAYLTVVLWFPPLDRLSCVPMGPWVSTITGVTSAFWLAPSCRPLRWMAVVAGLFVTVFGAWHLKTLDDVRRQQSLSPTLIAEQAEVQRLTGLGGSPQFFLVRASDTEEALRREEALGDRLAGAVAAGDITGWQSVARFVPSQARQRQNADLVREKLMRPHLAEYRATLGLDSPPAAPDQRQDALTLSLAGETGAARLLSNLVVSQDGGDVVHAVVLNRIIHADKLRTIASGLDGVYFVDPAEDLSNLFGQYRRQALLLFGLSVLFVLPLIIVRYGWRRGVAVTAAPVVAVALTPFVLACLGEELSFFSVIAFVLVFSVGVDYAVFFAEEGEHSESATRYAVLLAAATALLSNGLLAWSRVEAVHAFGMAMSVGLFLSYVMAPLATRAHRVRATGASLPAAP